MKFVKFGKKKKNKFGAIRTQCQLRYWHDSKGEAQHCVLIHLKLRATNNDWVRIRHEVKYLLAVNGQLIGVHQPDWTIDHKDGKRSVIEFKGRETRDWKLKMKLFKALYPEIPYIVVKKK